MARGVRYHVALLNVVMERLPGKLLSEREARLAPRDLEGVIHQAREDLAQVEAVGRKLALRLSTFFLSEDKDRAVVIRW